jgi:hypothetical protein
MPCFAAEKSNGGGKMLFEKRLKKFLTNTAESIY